MVRTDALTAAGQRMMHGTSGRPKFLGLFQEKNGAVFAMWDDGSLAERREDYTWRAVDALPDYDALFTRRVADDAPASFGTTSHTFCRNNRCLALHPADTVTCPDCGESFR